MKRHLISLIIMSLFISGNVFAGGGQHYPNGAEGVFAGMLPPPGFHTIFYVFYYTADAYNDNEGDEYTEGPFANFDADITVFAARFIYMTRTNIGGGQLGFHTLIPYFDSDLKSMGFSDSGVGDIFVGPVIAWHKPPYHYAVGVDVVIPTGEYEKGNPASVGKNFWTIEPIFAMTALYRSGWSWSFKAMYDFNTKNDEFVAPGTTGPEMELKPGDEFHVDYSIDYGMSPKLRAGVGGYYYRQMTDDEINGEKIKDERGQALGIGPVIHYQHSRNFGLQFKAHFETLVENRPLGMGYWLKAYKSF